MKPLVALCADMMCLQHPETLGLPGENFASQEWLRLFTSAQDARVFLQNDYSVNEVWVVSCDSIAPINLAATLKHDRPDRCVCLVAFEGTGSLKSRASAAGIDVSFTRQAFVERYKHRKHLGEVSQTDADFSRTKRAEGDRESPAPSHPQSQAKTNSQPYIYSSANSGTVHRSAGFLMPVVSGSGGAGKSTIAALSALLLHRMGLRTLLLDFDLQFGDMQVFLGVSRPLTIDEVLSAPAHLDRLTTYDNLPTLLAAPQHLEQSEVVVEQAPALLDQLMTRFDAIVCNTGAAWAEQHAVLLERSSKALFLVDQRASSLRACQHALDLCARCGIATSPFSFLVNRCTKNSLFTSIDVSCALHGVPVAELSEGGSEVEELLGAGLPTELVASRNALCKTLEDVLCSLLPQNLIMLDQSRDSHARQSGSGFRKASKSKKYRRGAA